MFSFGTRTSFSGSLVPRLSFYGSSLLVDPGSIRCRRCKGTGTLADHSNETWALLAKKASLRDRALTALGASALVLRCFRFVKQALVENGANSNVKPLGHAIHTAAFSPSGIA